MVLQIVTANMAVMLDFQTLIMSQIFGHSP